MKSIIAIILLSFFAASAHCQEKQYYLTIFTHNDWAKYPSEKQLVESLRQEPMLAVVNGCHFNHYTPKDEMYKDRFPQVDPSTFPVLMVQRVKDGGVVYKSSGRNVPASSSAIYADIKQYRDASESRSKPVQAEDDESPEVRRPWLNRDQDGADEDEDNPDSYEIFNGRTPIRDSLANSATFMQSAMILGLVIVVILSFAFAMKAFK